MLKHKECCVTYLSVACVAFFLLIFFGFDKFLVSLLFDLALLLVGSSTQLQETISNPGA